MLIPACLHRGDLVAVVASSGPVVPKGLSVGTAYLERIGFRVRHGCSVCENTGYLAGTDVQRCHDLDEMLRDPEVRGIFFARGGYGVMRLLDSLDLDAIRRDPKLMLGMSDVTALLLSLYRRCGLVTFAGPMTAGQCVQGLDAVSEASFLAAVSEPLSGRSLIPDDYPCRVVRPGFANGVLLGGCLSLVTSLLGTEHTPDFSGAILFLEDINEPPYRIDRMLVHLKLAGVLDAIEGLVLGHFLGPNCADISGDVERVAFELTGTNPVPVISGVPHGHALPNLTLPHGVPVVLRTGPPSLRVG